MCVGVLVLKFVCVLLLQCPLLLVSGGYRLHDRTTAKETRREDRSVEIRHTSSGGGRNCVHRYDGIRLRFRHRNLFRDHRVTVAALKEPSREFVLFDNRNQDGTQRKLALIDICAVQLVRDTLGLRDVYTRDWLCALIAWWRPEAIQRYLPHDWNSTPGDRALVRTHTHAHMLFAYTPLPGLS